MSADLTVTDHASTNNTTATIHFDLNTAQSTALAFQGIGSAEGLQAGSIEWNYTYNLAPMHRLALEGVTLHEGAPSAGLLLVRCDALYEAFCSHPDTFRALNPANGWGDFDQHWNEIYTLRTWLETHAWGNLTTTWSL